MSKVRIRQILFVVSVLVYISLASNSFAGQQECTRQMAMDADDAADQVNSWQTAYRAFIKFSACDDASIAEGFDDRIDKLLARDNPKYDELSGYIKRNSQFEKFVLRHAAGTGDAKVEITVGKKAASCFEMTHKPICKNIALSVVEAFEDAIKEIAQMEKEGTANKQQLEWKIYIQSFVIDVRKTLQE